jgi:NAD(P)-dependent dehydrogenase (short-subunit alcohol dehydrogenase family)
MDPSDGGVDSVAADVWHRTLQVNVIGALLASQTAVALAAERAAIVHIGSVVASRGSAKAQLAYTSSKGAVAAMSRELAVECAPRNIRVNTIVAGLLSTPLTASLVEDPVELGRRVAHIPLGRLGGAREVALAAIWLLSDDASYVTGTELCVDGGLSAAFVTGRER